MRRRDFLSTVGPAVIMLTSGCLTEQSPNDESKTPLPESSEPDTMTDSSTLTPTDSGCGDYDYLGMSRKPESELPPSNDRVMVEYSQLSQAEQQVVEEAIQSEEMVRRCHVFGGEGNGIQKLSDRFLQLQEEEDGEAFIIRDGEYYSLAITILDVDTVESVEPVVADSSSKFTA